MLVHMSSDGKVTVGEADSTGQSAVWAWRALGAHGRRCGPWTWTMKRAHAFWSPRLGGGVGDKDLGPKLLGPREEEPMATQQPHRRGW